MQEIIPVALGAIIGLAIQPVRRAWIRAVLLVALCLLAGMSISYMTGELRQSWMYVNLDALLIWLGAVLGLILAAALRRWRRTSSVA